MPPRDNRAHAAPRPHRGRLVCESCQRPYPRRESDKLRAGIAGRGPGRPIAEYPLDANGWLTKRAKASLAAAGITTAGDLLDAGDGLLDLDGIGPSTLAEIRDRIAGVRASVRESYAILDVDA